MYYLIISLYLATTTGCRQLDGREQRGIKRQRQTDRQTEIGRKNTEYFFSALVFGRISVKSWINPALDISVDRILYIKINRICVPTYDKCFCFLATSTWVRLLDRWEWRGRGDELLCPDPTGYQVGCRVVDTVFQFGQNQIQSVITRIWVQYPYKIFINIYYAKYCGERGGEENGRWGKEIKM